MNKKNTNVGEAKPSKADEIEPGLFDEYEFDGCAIIIYYKGKEVERFEIEDDLLFVVTKIFQEPLYKYVDKEKKSFSSLFL